MRPTNNNNNDSLFLDLFFFQLLQLVVSTSFCIPTESGARFRLALSSYRLMSHSLRILYPITGEWLESYFLFLFGFLRAPINEKHLVPHALSDPISYDSSAPQRRGGASLGWIVSLHSRPQPHGHAWQEKWRSG